MLLPKYTDKNEIERIGVHKAALILSEMGLIFRETSNSDTGVDGIIEEVDMEYHATGRIMAVQIKSGSSYLHDGGDVWHFYIDDAHKSYWKLYPIPVFLLVYNPDDGNVYYTDVKYILNTQERIDISKEHILCKANKEDFLKTIGGCISKYSDIEIVFNHMLQRKCDDFCFSVSFLELFISGLTNLCHDLFYDVAIAADIADVKGKGGGVSIDHDFLWEYVTYLVKENLVELNFHACLYDYEERKMQPRFIAPLTYRGRQLLNHISDLEVEYLEESDIHIVCESLINLNFDTYSIQRLNKLLELQSLLLAKIGQFKSTE